MIPRSDSVQQHYMNLSWPVTIHPTVQECIVHLEAQTLSHSCCCWFSSLVRLIQKNMTGDPEGGWYTLESCEAGCVECSKLPDFRISDRSLSTMHDLPNNVKRGHNIGLQCLWCSSECNRESGSMCRFSKLLTKEANNRFCLFFTVAYFFCPLDMLSPYDPSGCNQSNHGKHAVVKVIHKWFLQKEKIPNFLATFEK